MLVCGAMLALHACVVGGQGMPGTSPFRPVRALIAWALNAWALTATDEGLCCFVKKPRGFQTVPDGATKMITERLFIQEKTFPEHIGFNIDPVQTL